jgi:flagellar hook-associated protein 1 FlgK
LTAQQSALQNAESYLDEQITSTGTSGTPDSPNGLTADLSNLFNAFQGLSADPGNLSLRQTAVQAAQTVTQQFNNVSSQLSTVNSDLNTSLQNDTASANQYLSSIASLNGQIVQSEAAGGSANQFVDQREQDLESLAKLTNISTTAQSNGTVDVSIGNVTMVSGETTTDSLQTYDPGNGQLQVAAKNAGPLSITGGSLAGEVTARDGALAELRNGLDSAASELITNVNSIYSTGYDLNGNTGQNMFSGTGASDIAVNSALLADPSQFQAAGVPNAAGDNTTVLALGELANGGYYAQTVSNLGNSISTVNDQLTTSTAVAQSLANNRASTSGVSLDEQMTNQIQYQKAYEASAEMISTINQMLQTVVGMKSAS